MSKETINNNILGGGLLVSGSSQGFVGWVTQNAPTLSLTFTALSCLGGLFFLYLNLRATKRRTAEIEKHNSEMRKIAEREIALKEKIHKRRKSDTL